MNRKEKYKAFKKLHKDSRLLVLFNVWDSGTAKAVEHAGASAIATGSWSMAAAHGYSDGQEIPFDFVLTIVGRICASTELPVSVDFESGFAHSIDDLTVNTVKLIETGVVGINFEDQNIGAQGLVAINEQSQRIAAIKAASKLAGAQLFINARTDVFLQSDRQDHAGQVNEAIARARAFQDAGADGLFIPGLVDADLIGEVCEAVSLPVNVMAGDGLPNIAALDTIGVKRLSYGPKPFIDLMAAMEAAAMHAGRM